MSSIAAAETGLTLSSRQIDEWPEGGDLSAFLGDGWQDGRPVSFSIPPEERAVPVCRRLSRAWLDAQQIENEDTRYAVLLVISELTTNAILHSASSRVTSRLWRADGKVFVEVCDQGRSASVPRLGHPPETESHGRGLSIVTRCATSWGMRRGTGECTVWAAVDITGK